MNGRTTHVWDGHEYRDKAWQDVEVGDIVLVRNRELIPADLVLLAMGFTGVPADGVAAGFGLAVDGRGRVASAPERNIFVCGDSGSGASLVVRALADGKRVAREIGIRFEGGCAK